MSWQWYALGSAFFAGLTAVLGKVGVKDVNSNLATFIRTVVILLLIGAIVSWQHKWEKLSNLPTRSLIFLVLSGFATGLSWLCYYHALQKGPASRVAPIDKLSVVFAIALALLFLGEKLTWTQTLGGAFVTVGALLMM